MNQLQLNLLLQLVDSRPVRSVQDARKNTNLYNKLDQFRVSEADEPLVNLSVEGLELDDDEKKTLSGAIEAGMSQGMNGGAARHIVGVVDELGLE